VTPAGDRGDGPRGGDAGGAAVRPPDALPLLPARTLEATGCARAAFTTRRGGVSSAAFAALNLSFAVGDARGAVRENRRRLAAAWGVGLASLVEAAQPHGNRIAAVGPGAAGTVVPGVDALVTDAPGIWLAVSVADCVPLLVVDPDRPAVGALHAGWRGVASGIVPALLAEMGRRFRTRPGRLRAAAGPAIGPCCYEVDEPVARAMASASWWPDAAHRTGPGRWRLDLREAVRRELVAGGVAPDAVEVLPGCTMCRPDLFFSYRRDRVTGRLAGCIRLSA